MHEYWKTLQTIDQSIEKLVNNRSHSYELKQSARSLKISLNPCIEELKQSATKIKQLFSKYFEELEEAEKIYQNKPKIADIKTENIWEKLGEIIGIITKINKDSNKNKNEAIEQALDFWRSRINYLDQIWFLDSKSGKLKKDINWSDTNKIEQRKAEKEWLQQQKQQLIKMQVGITSIIDN